MRSKMLFPILGLFVLSLWFAPGVQADTTQDLVKAMAVFDQSYIPALLFSNKGEVAPAKKALAVAAKQWAAIDQKYAGANPGDEGWKSDFHAVTESLTESGRLLDEGKDIVEAHETLEEARMILSELRVRNNIDYFIDPLNFFHEAMEPLSAAVKDKKPGTLSSDDMGKIKKILEELLSLWQDVLETKFDPAVFGFSDKKTAALMANIKAEEETLTAAEKALAVGDKAALIKSAAAVKPTYTKVFLMFGDFAKFK